MRLAEQAIVISQRTRHTMSNGFSVRGCYLFFTVNDERTSTKNHGQCSIFLI